MADIALDGKPVIYFKVELSVFLKPMLKRLIFHDF